MVLDLEEVLLGDEMDEFHLHFDPTGRKKRLSFRAFRVFLVIMGAQCAHESERPTGTPYSFPSGSSNSVEGGALISSGADSLPE